VRDRGLSTLNTPQMIASLHSLAIGLRPTRNESNEFALRCGFSVSCPKLRRMRPKTASERVDAKQVDGLIRIAPLPRAEKIQGIDRIRDEPRRWCVIKIPRTTPGNRAMTKPDTPFPRHWRYYIAIKWR